MHRFLVFKRDKTSDVPYGLQIIQHTERIQHLFVGCSAQDWTAKSVYIDR